MTLDVFSQGPIDQSIFAIVASRRALNPKRSRSLEPALSVVEWEADESSTGPASLMLIDPDGNPVLIDQHVDSPPNLKNKTAGKT
jgi:hypothetical protein